MQDSIPSLPTCNGNAPHIAAILQALVRGGYLVNIELCWLRSYCRL